MKRIKDTFLDKPATASENYKVQTGEAEQTDNKFSITDEKAFAKYNKSITEKDIKMLQSFGRISINAFSDEQIEAAQKWAYKFYQQMGPKSPFFRRWFGDWRMYDETPITVADKKNTERQSKIKNKDTNWEINVPGKAINETSHHLNSASKAAVDYLSNLNSIVENAVLLNTETSNKGGQSLFYHYMYCIANIGNGKELLKLEVEEMNDPNSVDNIHRAYKLLNIENWQTGVKGSRKESASLITQSANVNNIADLYNLVNRKDKYFSAGKPVNEIFLNSNGTPKVFYHGTLNKDFTVFDFEKAND